MPASIRTLHSYTLQPNLSLGFDVFHPFTNKWGVMIGVYFDNKGMKTDTGVKGYHMKIVRGGEELEGIFTGSVITKTTQSLITVPLQATYNLGEKVRLKLGSYLSYVTAKKFEGWAYDGYLRKQEEEHLQGDSTGQKVVLGHNEGERGNYDFSDDMRNWQMRIDLGADWYITKRWGAYVVMGTYWGVQQGLYCD